MLVDDDFRLRLVGWSGLTSGRMLGGKSRALGSITFMGLFLRYVLVIPIGTAN